MAYPVHRLPRVASWEGRVVANPQVITLQPPETRWESRICIYCGTWDFGEGGFLSG